MENDFSCKALRLYDCFMNIRLDIINENARNKVNTDTVYNFGFFPYFPRCRCCCCCCITRKLNNYPVNSNKEFIEW